MTSRTISSAILAIAALWTFSCSKTQDTAPERRIFGAPPTIEAVDGESENFFKPGHLAECDFSDQVRGYFCSFGLTVELHPGGGFPPNDSLPDETRPGVFIEGIYDELTLRAKVSDPDSSPPPAQSNILLVTASFANPDPDIKEESSIVLFDDGSFNKFRFDQKGIREEECGPDPSGSCIVCTEATYNVVSTDLTAGDTYFTRKLALVDKQGLNEVSGYLQDCILRLSGGTTILVNRGDVFEFKIEAVDRQGNVSTWPTKVRAVIGASTFGCNGDPCGCCFLQSNDPSQPQPVGCVGLEGLTSPSYPDGYCKSL